MTNARRPRVAIVRHDLFPGEPHLRRSVHTLRDAGFAVDVFCDREPGRPRRERLEGVTVRRMLFQHKRHSVLRYLFEYVTLPFLAAAIVAAQSLRHRYDYVEVDNPPDWLVLAGLVPRLQGATVVLYMFENMPELMAADRGWRPNQARMRALVRAQYLSARLAHRLIAPHEMARRILVDQGVPPEKIAAVVPNVPDERVFLSGSQHQAGPVAESGGLHAPVGATSSGNTGVFRLVTHGTLLQRY